MFCPSCGTQVPNESSFCLKCGRSMSVAPNLAMSRKPEVIPDRQRWQPDQRILFALALLVALVCVVFYLNRELPLGAAIPNAGGPKLSSSPRTIKISPGEIATK